MGLFSKIKKGFKKIFKGIKKVVKKVVKGVKKVVKKISSSKILKALAIAAAVIVTGGAAISAFTGGAGLAASTTGSTFANWMMTTSSNVLAGTGISGIKASTKLGKFAQGAAKVVAKPFGAIGTTAGNLAAGVTDFTGLTTEAGRTGSVQASTISGQPFGIESTATEGAVSSGTQLTAEQILAGETPASIAKASVEGALNLPSNIPGDTILSGYQLNMPANIPGATGISAGASAAEQLAVNVLGKTPVTEAAKTNFWETYTGKALAFTGQQVGSALLQGAAAQYIQGDPELQGSMSGAAYESGEYMDPLKVYASQQNINTDDIYSHMMYGNQDPSSQYGNDLYRQQTFGVA